MGGILVAVVLGMIAYVVLSSRTSPQQPVSVAARYGCGNAEMTSQVHFHTHLGLYVNGWDGQPIPLPSGLGQSVGGGSAQSFCWIHTHSVTSAADSIIHVEAPRSELAKRPYTLGDFLAVWRLTDPQASFSPGPGQIEVAYVNGKRWTEAITNIPLQSLEDIEIEVLPAGASPTAPPAYKWPSGFAA